MPAAFALSPAAFARDVFGLADMHDRAELLALLRGAGVDRDERNLLGRTLFIGPEHVEVGDGHDHAIVVRAAACSIRRAMSARSPDGRVAVVDV